MGEEGVVECGYNVWRANEPTEDRGQTHRHRYICMAKAKESSIDREIGTRC